MEKHIEPLTVHDPMEEAGADFPVAQGRVTHGASAKQVAATERVVTRTADLTVTGSSQKAQLEWGHSIGAP